jgi:GT2 family glycosyltransferase
MTSPLVFIVILNWNSPNDTIASVESCLKLTWPNFRIVVVDNGSTDGSEDLLRSRLKDVEIIQSGSNLGYAGGNNVGIRHAMNNGADYVWLLNNDAVADPQALAALVEAMEADPAIGLAGSKIYYQQDPRRIWFAGGIWAKGRLRLRHLGAHKLDEGQFDELRETGSVSGCSMLVRSACVHDAGLMKEDYFLYWEDTEWCARAEEKGYKVLFVPGSRVWHKVSSSAGQSSFNQYYYYTRNGFFFLREYDPLLTPVFAAYNLLFVLKCLTFGNAQPLRGFMRGFFAFVKGEKGPIQSTSAPRVVG